MGDCYKTYNKTLKELIDIVSNELPRDSLMEDIKRKYTAAVTSDRTLLLTESGKELFAYRDYIAEGRWDELINKEWTEAELNPVDGVDIKAIQQMIIVLRGIWAKYDADEKKYIQKLIKTLLSEYVKYRMSNQ
jgi:hypothetical protein